MTSLLSSSHDVVVPVTAVDPVPEDSEVTPGPWMMILALGLILASVLLWLSMRKHLRRIRVPGDEAPAPTDDGSAAGQVRHDRPAGPPVS